MPASENGPSKIDRVTPHVEAVIRKFNETLPARVTAQGGRLLSEAQVESFIQDTYEAKLYAVDLDCLETFRRQMQFKVVGDKPVNREQPFFQALESPNCLVSILTNIYEKVEPRRKRGLHTPPYRPGNTQTNFNAGTPNHSSTYGHNTYNSSQHNHYAYNHYSHTDFIADEITAFFDVLDAELDALSSIEWLLYLPVALKRVFEKAVWLHDKTAGRFFNAQAYWDQFNERLKKHFAFLLKHHEYDEVIDTFVSGIALGVSMVIYLTSAISEILLSFVPLMGMMYLASFVFYPDDMLDMTFAWVFLWFALQDLDISLMRAFDAYEVPPGHYEKEFFSNATRKGRFTGIYNTYHLMLLNVATSNGGIDVYFTQLLTALLFSSVVIGVSLPYEALRLIRDAIDYALFSLKIASALILCAPLYLMDGFSYLSELFFGSPPPDGGPPPEPPEPPEPCANTNSFFSSCYNFFFGADEAADEAKKEAPEEKAYASCGVD